MNWADFKTLDIRSRMLLAALLPLGLISTLLAVVFLQARFDDLQASYELRNRSVVRQLALASEYGLFAANRSQLSALAAGVIQETDVRWVGILDARGQALATAGRHDQSPPLTLDPVATHGFDAKRQLDWLVQPAYASALQLDDLFEKSTPSADQPPRLLGQVVVVFSRHTVDAQKRQVLLTGALIGALSLLFGMVLAAYLSRGVIRPIMRISQLIERIGRGDFASVQALRSQPTQRDPLHQLQANIYLMADRLAQVRQDQETQIALATQALREKKEEAEVANLSKSRFLAAASHDLRQPTHALGLFVARLAQLPHDVQTHALIGNLEASVRAMQNLLDGLLDISRLEARAVQVNKHPFALSGLLHQLQHDLGPKAADKGLRLRVRPTDLWMLSDATLIYRVLLNLVGNAVRYTEHGGVLVAVRHRPSAGQLLLQVWDSGVGIAPEHQQAVFAEFYQVANPARDRTKGLGLGLNIVQRTLALLGHPLSLRSVPGRGTCFSLSLPLASSQASAPLLAVPAPELASAGDDVRGQTVLVVEDDTLARAALVGLLESWGMRVLAAADAAQALACVAQPGASAPSVIVSDYRLPDEDDGMALVLRLRQQLGYPVPACLISGDTDPALIQRARSAGLTLLHKPVRPAKLRSLLRRLLQSSGMGAERS